MSGKRLVNPIHKLRRVLYLQTFLGNWGDAVSGFRCLRHFREVNPDIVLYACINESCMRQIGAFSSYEGLLDDIVSLPFEIYEEDASVIEFLKTRYGELSFDLILLGCCLNNDFRGVPLFHSKAVSYLDKEFLPILDVEIEQIPVPEDLHKYVGFWGLKNAVAPLLKSLPRDKKNIAFFPRSTRVFGAVHLKGFEKVVNALKDNYNIIILGPETDLFKGEAWKYESYSGIDQLRALPVMQECFDWMGLSPLKQMEIIKHCLCTVISTTGAVAWAYLLKRPVIGIQGGEWGIEFYTRYNDKFVLVDPPCDLFPCTDESRKCTTLPYCLSEGINIEGLLKAVEEVEKFS